MDYGYNNNEYVFTQPSFTSFSGEPAPSFSHATGFPSSVLCPNCNQDCILKFKKDTNRPYYACNTHEYGGTCSNPKGWFKWADELNNTTQKRPPMSAPSSQPDAKRQELSQSQCPTSSGFPPRQVFVTPDMVKTSQIQILSKQIEIMAGKIDFIISVLNGMQPNKEQ